MRFSKSLKEKFLEVGRGLERNTIMDFSILCPSRVWGVGAAGDWAIETLIPLPLLCFSVSCSSLMIKLDFK